MSTRPGDALLFAVSAARDMPWERFKAVVEATCKPDGKMASEMRHVRAEAAAVGDALGHWEFASTGATRRIVAAPPVLARLPWPGLPCAVLCGSRSPDTLADIRAISRSIDGIVVSTSIQLGHPYAPSRIQISATSEQDMAAAAEAFAISYSSTPPAWSIAVASGSVDQYLASLAWENRADLNWDRREFDPDRLRFGAPLDSSPPALRLIEYSHPSGWAWKDWLWMGEASTDVDRDWGRYVLLESAGQRVLRHDLREGVVTVPRQVPLPKLLSRALALCSGHAPTVVAGTGIGLRAYPSVPRPIFDSVAAKLHQDRLEDRLPAEGSQL